MKEIYISARCRNLLTLLLNQSDYLTVNQIAKLMNVSRRTIYYDMEKINDWMDEMNLQKLEIIREKGIFLSGLQKEKLQKLLEENVEEQKYIFLPQERVKLIICYIIYENKPIFLEQLTSCFDVSRNTIFNDLKDVDKQLAQYDLKLEYKVQNGYFISGDAVRIRALFLLYFNEMMALFKSGMIPFFQPEEIQVHYELLKTIEKELGIEYVEGVVFSLAALVPIMYMHRTSISFPDLKEEEVCKTREYELIHQYFPVLPAEEKLYLTLHFLGSRVNFVSAEFFDDNSRKQASELAKILVSEFERTACVFFDDRHGLERALFLHLTTSLYRYKYGIQIGNILGNDVMTEYSELFAIAKVVINRLENILEIPIPDSEVAYLALHFGAYLNISEPENDHLRILIVCVNGISTGNMIRREVQKLLPFSEIIDVVSGAEVQNAQKICDLIISTVRINSVVPVIVVHPILNEFDRRAILRHRLVAPKYVEIKREQIFKVVKKYVNPNKYPELLQDLTAYIQGEDDQQFEGEDEQGLLRFLDASRIRIINEKCSWQESIRLVGRCLIDYKSIEETYLDMIIHQLNYYGMYMFLTEEIILAHAKPEDGVNSMDVSLGIFKEPVNYSQSHRARVVFILAAEDQEKHLKTLQDILNLMADAEFISHLMECVETSAVMELIKVYLDKNKES